MENKSMSQKIKTILIIILILIMGILLFFYITKDNQTNQTTETPWYSKFNPFTNRVENPITGGTDDIITNNQPDEIEMPVNTENKFDRISDNAVAGATFFEDKRLIENKEEFVEVLVNTNNLLGKKEIQKILNEKLSITPALIADGVFGQKTIKAIKDLQKLNNLPETGKIDEETNKLFVTKVKNENQYETVPALRYVERFNGHVYNVHLDTKIISKISNTTIPGIYETYFDNQAQNIIYRYLSENKEIITLLASLGSKNSEFLTSNIPEVGLSKDKKKLFYLTKNQSGVNGIVLDFESKKKNQVFKSSFSEWLIDWAGDNKILLTTKPAFSVQGNIFELNTNTGVINKIFGGIYGLTSLSNSDISNILYNISINEGPRLNIFNVKNNTSEDLGYYGLPEKCVWSKDNITIYCAVPRYIPKGQYPDSWYQGLVSFDDYFIKINTLTGERLNITSDNDEIFVDAIKLFLDKDETKIFFINKKDGTLWSVLINEQSTITN